VTSTSGVGDDGKVVRGCSSSKIVSTVTVAAVGIIGGDNRVGSPTVAPQARSRSSLLKGDNDWLTENLHDTGQTSPTYQMKDVQGQCQQRQLEGYVLWQFDDSQSVGLAML
jgi:hypothetical protein